MEAILPVKTVQPCLKAGEGTLRRSRVLPSVPYHLCVRTLPPGTRDLEFSVCQGGLRIPDLMQPTPKSQSVVGPRRVPISVTERGSDHQFRESRFMMKS